MSETFITEAREAVLRRQPLRITGGGSKDFYGGVPGGEVLSTRQHAGIINYEPSELVITARAGTPLAEVKSALAERRQHLPFEPPAFGAATLGGTVASGLSGPRRMAAGSLRDHVLGVTLMDGQGRVVRFGGEVMKNVAGFDVSRLIAGSLGTLGLILDVSLKVLPLPAAEATLRFELDEAGAQSQVNAWVGRAMPVSASCWHAGVLSVRLSGAAAAVDSALATLGGQRLDSGHAEHFWDDLREQRHAFFAGDAPLWRLSLPPLASPITQFGPMLVEWLGGQRWLRGEFAAADLQAGAAHAGGHATLFRGGNKAAGVFQPADTVLLPVLQRLKQEFDPHGLFNRGRMYPEL